MVEHRERLLKLTHEMKNHKRLVKPHQLTRLGSVLEPARDGSSGSSGSRDAAQHAVVLSKERSRPVDGLTSAVEEGVTARTFNLPLCFMEKDFFEGFPLNVSDTESDINRRLDEEGLRKHMASGMVGLMKVAEMDVVLAGEGAGYFGLVRELESEKETLKAKTQKLKSALERSEEKFQVRANELTREKEKTAKAYEERDSLLLERERLEKEVADLKAAMFPVDGEPEGVTDLHSRAELIARIQILESDCDDILTDGFETTLTQLSVLNPGLNTDGVGVLSQFIDGQVVPLLIPLKLRSK